MGKETSAVDSNHNSHTGPTVNSGVVEVKSWGRPEYPVGRVFCPFGVVATRAKGQKSPMTGYSGVGERPGRHLSHESQKGGRRRWSG